MKFWAGITVYDGSASLVELRGWKSTVSEAYQRVGVPEGRDQVLQATKYLSGDAEKWWRSVAGQPRGQGMATFEELYQALEQRFIPRSVFQKAIRDWNSLKQTGSAEEYMRRVDELATVQPLGEVAEFWHAWEGMRPELKAEVQFHLQAQGRQTCPREELWTLLWNAETRYPLRQSSPVPLFVFHSNPLLFEPLLPPRPPRSVGSVTPKDIGRMCVQRDRLLGCARCGSKAHDLVACPQRPDLRRTAAARPSREGAPPSGRKNKTQTEMTGGREPGGADASLLLGGMLHHPSSSMPRALRYRLSTEGGSIDALVDSGAEMSLISEDAVKRRGNKCTTPGEPS